MFNKSYLDDVEDGDIAVFVHPVLGGPRADHHILGLEQAPHHVEHRRLSDVGVVLKNVLTLYYIQ